MVLMQALEQAGTAVCEPVVQARLEVPTPAIGAMLAALGAWAPGPPRTHGATSRHSRRPPRLPRPGARRLLPALTSGEGVLESDFAGYEPVTGDPPTRRRR